MIDHSHPALSPVHALPPDLVEALRRPFAPQEVRLHAGRRRPATTGDSWICLAIPLVPYQTLKARLDHLVPERWSSSFPSLIVAGGRLVAVAQLRIGRAVQDASSEIPFQQAALLNATEELLTQVPEAFEAAVVKACAQFGLGSYLAELAREWVPFDTERGRIALSEEQQHAHVLKLYQQAGLAEPPHPAMVRSLADRQVPSAQTGEMRDGTTPFRPSAPLSKEAWRSQKIAWVRQQCAARPGSLANILEHWHVYNLDALSDDDLRQVVTSIQQSPTRALPKAS